MVRKQLYDDIWALIKLYSTRYPDTEIEGRLAEALYRIASEDDNPRRRAIVDAMRDVGSASALPVLEAIEFDLRPSVKSKQIFAEAIERPSDEFPEDFRSQLQRKLPGLEVASRAQFLSCVALAIDAIKSRSSAGSSDPEGSR
jgi:hypothetical protein